LATRDKRIEAMRRNPKQVTADEMDAALLSLGFKRGPGKGDHRHYYHPDLGYPVVIDPARPHLKRYIVLQALEAIDELQEESS
jgi:predicted RNA binding protein YcfA (HicA-like mRNA interferase family)